MSETKTAKINATTVGCPSCTARTGERCVTSTGNRAKQPHPARKTAAYRATLCTECGALGHERHDGKPCSGAAGLGTCPCGPVEPVVTHAIVDGETVSLDRDVIDVEPSALAVVADAIERGETTFETVAGLVEHGTSVEQIAGVLTACERVRTETATETVERVRRTVVTLAAERVAAVIPAALIKLDECAETLLCVRCERFLPSTTFPTVKSGGETYRKTECRACRSARSAAGLRTDGAARGTRKPRASRSDAVSAENAATAALAATLDLDAIARSL